MNIAIVYCETCHDATVYIDGVEVKGDRFVSSPFTKDGHTGVRVEWEQ